jgi:hypothetical protein
MGPTALFDKSFLQSLTVDESVRRVDEHLAVVHEPTPEAEAYRRWQERDFLEVERRFAKAGGTL